MTEKTPLLSLVTTPDGHTVHLHGDLVGLQLLHRRIGHLIDRLSREECDHDHFRSPDWAGWDLSTSMLQSEKAAECEQVHHLKVFAWTNEWKEKNGL
jgi:hypothetical protein